MVTTLFLLWDFCNGKPQRFGLFPHDFMGMK